MKITLKLYASLGNCLPAAAKKNQIILDVDDGISVGDALGQYNVPIENCHLVLINGIFTHPSKIDEKILADGDALAVWPPVAGG